MPINHIPADSRGHADHGWLDSYHSFSFANYYNPDRMNFGLLRVLNDDTVAAGMGFGAHPHSNMEIISIPLEGDLQHKDSMGNTTVIREGDIQVMSAGTGVTHSEYNHSKEAPVKFLQIWIVPNEANVQPRYDQIPLSSSARPNQLSQVLSPRPEDEGVWIHQNAWMHLGKFDQETQLTHEVRVPGNGLYAFLLEGKASINDNKMEQRDALAITDEQELSLHMKSGSRLLLIEVPMSN